MIKVEDIAQHLETSVPDWIYNLREFKAIYKAIASFIVEIRNTAEKLQNNQFIFECDETGLQKYEKMYGLKTDVDIDIRKINLYNYYNNNCSFTLKWFIGYMDSIFGKEAWTYDLKDYHLTITINDAKFYLHDTILNDLRSKIPANIGLSIYRADKIENEMYVAGLIREVDKITI